MGESTNEHMTKNIINEFAKTIEMFGLTTLEARLFAFLYLTDKPMTLDEMSEALGKSKTAMSTSMRKLAELNLVKRVWEKGVRKDLYQAAPQFKTFINSYLNRWIDAANNQKDALKEIQDQLASADQSEEQQRMADRLNDMIGFHAKIATLFRDMKQD